MSRVGSAQNLLVTSNSADLEGRLDMLMNSQMLLGRQLEEVALQLRLLRESQDGSFRQPTSGQLVGAPDLGGEPLPPQVQSKQAATEGASESLAVLKSNGASFLMAVFSTAAAGAVLGSGLALLAFQRR